MNTQNSSPIYDKQDKKKKKKEKKKNLWSYRTRQNNKNWCLRVEKILQKSEISLSTCTFYNKTRRQFVIESLENILFTEYKADWKNKVMSNVSISKNNGGSKLRTYKLFKRVYETEHYVKIPYHVKGENEFLSQI